MNTEDALAYTPELGDNRDKPEDEQTWCELLPMTGEEIRAYQRAMIGVKPGSAQAMKKAEQVVQRVISERVVSITNYDDIKGNPITNGAELFERGETEMVDELYEALKSISKLKAGRRKN